MAGQDYTRIESDFRAIILFAYDCLLLETTVLIHSAYLNMWSMGPSIGTKRRNGKIEWKRQEAKPRADLASHSGVFDQELKLCPDTHLRVSMCR